MKKTALLFIIIVFNSLYSMELQLPDDSVQLCACDRMFGIELLKLHNRSRKALGKEGLSQEDTNNKIQEMVDRVMEKQDYRNAVGLFALANVPALLRDPWVAQHPIGKNSEWLTCSKKAVFDSQILYSLSDGKTKEELAEWCKYILTFQGTVIYRDTLADNERILFGKTGLQAIEAVAPVFGMENVCKIYPEGFQYWYYHAYTMSNLSVILSHCDPRVWVYALALIAPMISKKMQLRFDNCLPDTSVHVAAIQKLFNQRLRLANMRLDDISVDIVKHNSYTVLQHLAMIAPYAMAPALDIFFPQDSPVEGFQEKIKRVRNSVLFRNALLSVCGRAVCLMIISKGLCDYALAVFPTALTLVIKENLSSLSSSVMLGVIIYFIMHNLSEIAEGMKKTRLTGQCLNTYASIQQTLKRKDIIIWQ